MDIVYKASDPLDDTESVMNKVMREDWRQEESYMKKKILIVFIASIMKSVQVVCIESVP